MSHSGTSVLGDVMCSAQNQEKIEKTESFLPADLMTVI